MRCPQHCDDCAFATEIATGNGCNADINPGCMGHEGKASWDEIELWWDEQEPVYVTARPMGVLS